MPIQDGLVLYLDAGDLSSYPGSGETWTDLSGNGNNGTLENGVGYNSANGGFLVFDGVDDWVDTTFGENIVSTGFTFNFWFYGTKSSIHFVASFFNTQSTSNESADSTTIFRVERFSGGSNTIEFGHSPNGATIGENELISYNFPNNIWTYCTLVYDGNYKYIYKNGVLDAISSPGQILTYYPGASLRIGARQNGDLLPFAGNIPIISLYNKALTATEIQQNYNDVKSRYENKVVLPNNRSLQKDVKLGDDKRPVSIIPNNEVRLYNIANGELLTDEFGTPVIAEVDELFIKDATMDRSTSIVVGNEVESSVKYTKSSIGSTTATYSSTNTNIVGIITTGIKSGDLIFGASIPDATIVSRVGIGSVFISRNTINASPLSESVLIERIEEIKVKSNPVIKIAEQFKETSQVSTTLLGINRAETQLSLFSNVSSYGLDSDEFEFYSFSEGNSQYSWDNRRNALYGNRYLAKQTEETQESAIKITAFPTPYTYPFGPRFEKTGLYNEELFQQYLNFIQMGNDLYNLPWVGYPSSWKENFLPSAYGKVEAGDVNYGENVDDSFAKIDIWTDTWRDIKDSILIDPTTSLPFTFAKASDLIPGKTYTSTDTRPGYSDSQQRYAYLQSRRVFRYQPGRISGFTFGLRSSTEAVTGINLEWGIANPTDQYVFRINAGQFSIVRRSTVPLEPAVLIRNNLTSEDQKNIPTGDPFDDRLYWTIDIPRDKFNGDPLNSNGPSGYLLQPEKVTMYKIEFGWYGAIGARFYAYIPTDNGDARWVVIHTLVIENSLESPCLRDSYFRFKYSLNIDNTGDVRSPQYLYKYGASYYIDGGDEGTSEIYSVSSDAKTILSNQEKTLLGITPKTFIKNRDGIEIENKKLIIPTELNISSDSLSEIKVVTCAACPGFGHVYTPGIATTETGRYIDIEFTGQDTIAAINDSYFTENDIGAKLIAPSIYNAYIKEVTDPVGTAGSFGSAEIGGFVRGLSGFSLVTRGIPGSLVYDRVAGIVTSIPLSTTNNPQSYPYPVRLSNYNAYAASDSKLTGSKIEIQFINPENKDDYGHWADFLIGVTDKVPDFSLPNTLNGFIVGGATTTILPNNDILFGEHTHSDTSYDENGVESGEAWWPQQIQARMAIDYRIPTVSNPAGGFCSKISIDVQDPTEIQNAVQFAVNPETEVNDGSYYIQIPDTFPSVSYDGGQVAYKINETEYTTGNIKYVGEPIGPYIKNDSSFSYIEISAQITQSNNFSILLRPVTLTANSDDIVLVNSGKVFNYNPFPLYLVAKLKDNSQINNITIKETVGTFQRTITPKWYTYDNVSIELYDGKADNASTSPTNFKEIDRLSSALIDTQNNCQLRPVTTRDTLYVGENDTQSINMSKVFGADRSVITPDNNNIEATFVVARKINSGSGNIETSLNFKEQ